MDMMHSYRKLLIAIAINTIIMYFLTYLMINSLDSFHFHLNSLYMALAMAAPMAVVMILVMRDMYMNMRKNIYVIGGAALIFLLAVIFIRTQTPIGDGQFLRSMIPHHSGAILMCREADLSDPEIIELCDQIIQSQQEEIDQMEAILDRSR